MDGMGIHSWELTYSLPFDIFEDDVPFLQVEGYHDI